MCTSSTQEQLCAAHSLTANCSDVNCIDKLSSCGTKAACNAPDHSAIAVAAQHEPTQLRSTPRTRIKPSQPAGAPTRWRAVCAVHNHTPKTRQHTCGPRAQPRGCSTHTNKHACMHQAQQAKGLRFILLCTATNSVHTRSAGPVLIRILPSSTVLLLPRQLHAM